MLWSVEMGRGFGGPAVRDGEVYVLDRLPRKGAPALKDVPRTRRNASAREKRAAEKRRAAAKKARNRRFARMQDVLRVFDLETGEELWSYAYNAPGTVKGGFPGSRTTPTVGEKYVYTVGPKGQLHCIDRATHKPVWKRHLVSSFGSVKAEAPEAWGFVQSPLIYGDTVIIAPQNRKVGVAALDKATGQIVWKTPFIGNIGWSSPVLMNLDGVDTIVMICNRKGINGLRVVGLDAATGQRLWNYDGQPHGHAIPYPTDIGDGRLFITNGYTGGCAMIRVTREGDKWKVTELFRNDDLSSQVHQPLLYEGHLYANSNSNEWQHGMVCMDLDGNLKWKTNKRPWFERSPLVMADGLIFNLDGSDGTLRLIEPNPDGYKELAAAKVLGIEPFPTPRVFPRSKHIWGPMALVDGKLLCRDQKEMKCLDVAVR